MYFAGREDTSLSGLSALGWITDEWPLALVDFRRQVDRTGVEVDPECHEPGYDEKEESEAVKNEDVRVEPVRMRLVLPLREHQGPA